MSLSPKKILAIALCCAGLYAAVLGGMAIAQDPAADLDGDPRGLADPGGAGVTPTPTAVDAETPTPTARPPTATPT